MSTITCPACGSTTRRHCHLTFCVLTHCPACGITWGRRRLIGWKTTLYGIRFVFGPRLCWRGAK